MQPPDQKSPEEIIHNLQSANRALSAVGQQLGAENFALRADLSMAREGLQSVSEYAKKLEGRIAEHEAKNAIAQTDQAVDGVRSARKRHHARARIGDKDVDLGSFTTVDDAKNAVNDVHNAVAALDEKAKA